MACRPSRTFRIRCGTGLLTLMIGALGAGCQSTHTAAADLPGPNFAGPVVVRKFEPPVIPPIKSTQVVKAPTKAPQDVAAWLPIAGAEKRQWKWIVVHHSATSVGAMARFDRDHKAKGWDELGYHFVIGNGTESGDGQIEVGSRWPKQKHGAHTKTPDNQFNDHGIGICLVGNFEETRPTAKQMAALTRLAAYLSNKYNVAPKSIIGHKDSGRQTDCPGKNMDLAALRAAVAKQRTVLVEERPTDPNAELMLSAKN